MKGDSSRKTVTERSIAFLLIGIILSLIVYSFFHYYDVSDEGFSLYQLRSGRDANYVTLFHLLPHYVGKLFNHSLLIYRALGLFLLYGSGCYLIINLSRLYFEDKVIANYFRVYSMIAIALYYQGFSIISYNLLACVSLYLWSGGLIAIFLDKKKYLGGAVLMGGASMIAFRSRFPIFICLLLLAPFLFFIFDNKRDFTSFIIEYYVSSFFFVGIFLVIFSQNFENMVNLLNSQLHSLHNNSIGLHVKHSFKMLQLALCYFFLFIALNKVVLCMKIENNCSRKVRVIYILPALFCIYVLFMYISKYFFDYFISLSFGVVLFYYVYYQRQRKFLLLGYLVIVAAMSGLGTNGNFIARSNSSFLLLAAPLFIVIANLIKIKKFKRAFATFFVATVFICTFSILYKEQFKSHYRSTRLEQQIFDVKLPYLRYVKVDRNNYKIFNKLESAFDRVSSSARVFAYPDLPGLLAPFNIKSLGNSWNFSSYDNVDEYNCAYIHLDFEQKKIDHVYFLLGEPLTPVLKKCLERYVDISSANEEEIGTFYHIRNKKEIQIKLFGPMTLKR